MSIYVTINELIGQSKKASPDQLRQLIDRASAAPFAGDLLEADEALWGSFWQGDVIAPGYLLPAAELALLRAIRLDKTWPEETTVTEFLADLRQAIRHPQGDVWMLRPAGEPCVVFAAPLNVEHSTFNVQHSTFNVSTVVWYCATTDQLHTGYRAVIPSLDFSGVPPQPQPNWLMKAVAQIETLGGRRSVVGGPSLATRLDAEILQIRLRGSIRPETE